MLCHCLCIAIGTKNCCQWRFAFALAHSCGISFWRARLSWRFCCIFCNLDCCCCYVHGLHRNSNSHRQWHRELVAIGVSYLLKLRRSPWCCHSSLARSSCWRLCCIVCHFGCRCCCLLPTSALHIDNCTEIRCGWRFWRARVSGVAVIGCYKTSNTDCCSCCCCLTAPKLHSKSTIAPNLRCDWRF